MKTITFEINRNGKVRIEPSGFNGTECLNATKPYEDALGIAGEPQITAEMFAIQQSQAKEKEIENGHGKR